jgi:hypothetical protein
MNRAGIISSTGPTWVAAWWNTVRARHPIVNEPISGSSGSQLRPVNATNSSPITRPSTTVMANSLPVGTTLGAKPAENSTTPRIRSHHG